MQYTIKLYMTNRFCKADLTNLNVLKLKYIKLIQGPANTFFLDKT